MHFMGKSINLISKSNTVKLEKCYCGKLKMFCASDGEKSAEIHYSEVFKFVVVKIYLIKY